jgi:polyphosphate glucokinase
VQVVGIDIGGTGIKGAPVDLDTGQLAAERVRLPTPQPAVPAAVAGLVGQIITAFGWRGPVGITFPGVVVDGVVRTAANVDGSWLDTDARSLFGAATGAGTQAVVLNDADAAGMAEMRFGAGAGHTGTAVLLTFGTGIGSALFAGGELVPNTEFGHLHLHGREAEQRASGRARELQDLSWGKWAGRVDEYLAHLEALLSPSLIIIGGGISKKADKFMPYLTSLRSRVVPAALLNNAGIVGAAMAAAR